MWCKKGSSSGGEDGMEVELEGGERVVKDDGWVDR